MYLLCCLPSMFLVHWFLLTSAGASSYEMLLVLLDVPLVYGSCSLELALDALSVSLLCLIALFVPIIVMLVFSAPGHAPLLWLLSLLALLSLSAAFLANDMLLFYVLFEAGLLPLYALILVFGARTRRVLSAAMLLLYTMLGSVTYLIGMIVLLLSVGSSSVALLHHTMLAPSSAEMLSWMFLVTFLVKLPSLPVHVWLPLAHAEAPTVGSVLLAALVLKLSAYGLLRFLLPCFNQALVSSSALLGMLAVCSLVYSSLLTLRQIDLKRLIAYSSVAHMALMLAAVLMSSSLVSAILGMLVLVHSHALSSALLFALIGMLYDRIHSRLLKYSAGLLSYMPL